MVEHELPKLGVAGSIPVYRSRREFWIPRGCRARVNFLLPSSRRSGNDRFYFQQIPVPLKVQSVSGPNLRDAVSKHRCDDMGVMDLFASDLEFLYQPKPALEDEFVLFQQHAACLPDVERAQSLLN